MADALLVYPYCRPFPDRSIFRQPPLGICYVAASLRAGGHAVRLLDCTFMSRKAALASARAGSTDVVGVYCMAGVERDALWLARELRSRCRLLVAGGPLPTSDPGQFLDIFDVVVRGEGEQTTVELLRAFEQGSPLAAVTGISLRHGGRVCSTPARPPERDLDRIPFPARDLLPNELYIRHGKRRYGFSVTTVLSTRGCPYTCEFCANVIHGGSYRERSPARVVDEIEQALALGYDRIAFADDVFTMSPPRVTAICREMQDRRLRFSWECLARVDAFDDAMAMEMKRAGCVRVFFGIESGTDAVLTLMNKRTSVGRARDAVHAAAGAGLQVGAFFILFYPGETDESVLQTLRFAGSLPLDYVGLTMPYPLPGTVLRERVRARRARRGPSRDGEFSRAKMWAGIIKGHVQIGIRRRWGRLAPAALKLFERPTDTLLRIMH